MLGQEVGAVCQSVGAGCTSGTTLRIFDKAGDEWRGCEPSDEESLAAKQFCAA